MSTLDLTLFETVAIWGVLVVALLATGLWAIVRSGLPQQKLTALTVGSEAVKAVVETVDGVDGTPELAAELIEYCREHLADVKCPRSIDFRDELPRHPTGKLYKRLLRDPYWAGREQKI